MNSAELVRSGRLEEGLSALQAEIRAKPEDTPLRIFFFQLNCVLGRFDKALTQLQVLAGLDAETMLMAQIFRPVIACELLRREVFLGKRTPLLFGEPAEWMSWLLQANQLTTQSEFLAAADLRSRALEAAPASTGTINGEPFEWIGDADSRFGPVLEAFIEGKYYWLPFCRLQKIESPKPADMRDLVWLPVQLTLSNGASIPAHIPARYPGTEMSTDGLLRLGRKTEWQENAGETSIGLGQRVLATDANDYPLLECREIALQPSTAEELGK
jgi:type VI secretion system protein ImpE